MKLYNSYIKISKKGSAEDVILVKDSISYPALFFTPLWIIHHKMWKEGAIFAGIFVVLFFLKDKFITSGDIFSIYVAMALMISVNANYWYSQLLHHNGYEFRGCIFGKSPEAAKVKFIDNYLEDERNGFADSIFEVTKAPAEKYFTI
jgi:hypothetical protein